MVRKRWMSVLVVLTVLFLTMQGAYGADEGLHAPLFVNRTTVLSGTSNFVPDRESLLPDTTAVPFQQLYGNGGSKGLFRYYGEVPLGQKESGYRYFPGDTVSGVHRSFSGGGETLDPQTDDLHVRGLTYQSGMDDFSGGMFSGALAWVANKLEALTGWMLKIRAMSLGDVLEALDNGGFVSALSDVFLFSVRDGVPTLSPFLVVGLAGWMVHAAVISFRMLRGQASLKPVLQEAAVMLLALFVAGVSFAPKSLTKFGNVGVNWVTQVSNAVVTSGMGDHGTIWTSIVNGKERTDTTQMSLISKGGVDATIEAQLGYPVAELDLLDGSMGDVSLIDQAAAAAFGGDAESFYLYTDTGRQNGVCNFGYWVWAANSGTSISGGFPFHDVFYSDAEGFHVGMDSSDRILLAIDFLDELAELNPSMREKCERIMTGMYQPNHGKLDVNMLMLVFRNVTLLLGLGALFVPLLKAQAVVVLGVFAVVGIPALSLFPPTRRLSHQIVMSYLLSYLRFALLSAMFDATIMVCAMLTEQGTLGMFLAAAVSLLMMTLGKNAIYVMNRAISRKWGGKELSFVNRMYSSQRVGTTHGGMRGAAERMMDNPVSASMGYAGRAAMFGATAVAHGISSMRTKNEPEAPPEPDAEPQDEANKEKNKKNLNTASHTHDDVRIDNDERMGMTRTRAKAGSDQEGVHDAYTKPAETIQPDHGTQEGTLGRMPLQEVLNPQEPETREPVAGLDGETTQIGAGDALRHAGKPKRRDTDGEVEPEAIQSPSGDGAHQELHTLAGDPYVDGDETIGMGRTVSLRQDTSVLYGEEHGGEPKPTERTMPTEPETHKEAPSQPEIKPIGATGMRGTVIHETNHDTYHVSDVVGSDAVETHAASAAQPQQHRMRLSPLKDQTTGYGDDGRQPAETGTSAVDGVSNPINGREGAVTQRMKLARPQSDDVDRTLMQENGIQTEEVYSEGGSIYVSRAMGGGGDLPGDHGHMDHGERGHETKDPA